MTRISFYQIDGAEPELLTFACRLTEQAWRRGMRVVIFSPSASLATAIDARLWDYSASSFLAHDPAHTVGGGTAPIDICCDDQTAPATHHGLLINFDAVAPSWFGRFERLAEIIYGDGAVRDAKRARYRYYRDRGYPLAYHDLTTPPSRLQ